ncbi:hypothetical protein AAVH_05941 [Aphelenchoides avenae]|nr:hypothetical protein AAVH_05941 [Aphelenchus avenae]
MAHPGQLSVMRVQYEIAHEQVTEELEKTASSQVADGTQTVLVDDLEEFQVPPSAKDLVEFSIDGSNFAKTPLSGKSPLEKLINIFKFSF